MSESENHQHICPGCGAPVPCDREDPKSMPPFTHPQFFLGSLHAVEYMMEAARETQGARVWAMLFETMRANTINAAEAKGMKLR